MKDKDAELMMEGLYKEAEFGQWQKGPVDPEVDASMRAYRQPGASDPQEPVRGPEARGLANLIPYSILGQLQQELEEMWSLGGKDAAQATTQSGQSIQQVVGDIVNMAVSRAGAFVAKNPDPTGHGAAEVDAAGGIDKLQAYRDAQ